jgi:hypothetical protein
LQRDAVAAASLFRHAYFVSVGVNFA